MVEPFDLSKIEQAQGENFADFAKIIDEATRAGTLVLFGAGVAGIAYFHAIKRVFSQKIVFCDNNKAKQSAQLCGIPIISFAELQEKYKESCIIVTAPLHSESILQQLHDAGLTGYLYNYYDLVRLHLEEFSLAYSLLKDEVSREVFYARIQYYVTDCEYQ